MNTATDRNETPEFRPTEAPAGGDTVGALPWLQRTHGQALVRAVGAVALLAFVVALPNYLNAYQLSLAVGVILAAIGAVALNLLTGWAGQVSIGSAAFLALGAWTLVLVPWAGFIWGTLLGGLVCALVGFLIGLPALRLRGLYLSLATIALQYVVVWGLTKYETAKDSPSGFILQAPTIAGHFITSDTEWFYLTSGVLLVTLFICRSLRFGKPGRAWLAIAQHDVAAGAIGINVTRYKLYAFVISSFFTGIAGALGAWYVMSVADGTYTITLAVSYVAMIIIGGMGSVYGPVFGAIVVGLLPQFLDSVTGWWPSLSNSTFMIDNLSYIQEIVYGLLVLVILMTQPNGIAGLANSVVSLVQRVVGSRSEDHA